MTREHEALQQIYQSTRGYCHRCRRKLAFSAYARAARGAWGIDAGPLQPACTTCLTGHVPSARSAPPRRRRPDAVTASDPAPALIVAGLAPTPAWRHTLLGGLLGAFVAGPWGALLGGLLGAEVDEG